MLTSEWRCETTFSYDYWQVFLYDAAAVFSPERKEFVEAAKDSQSGVKVGIAGPLVDVPMPTQWNFHAPIEIVVTDAAPVVDSDAWDHVVEFDLDLPSGRLVLNEPAAGAGEGRTLPPGRYRARFAGRQFQEAYDWASDTAHQPDSYRLELWPRTQPQPTIERKRWPGYDRR